MCLAMVCTKFDLRKTNAFSLAVERGKFYNFFKSLSLLPSLKLTVFQ
jgi:hypothetical protein